MCPKVETQNESQNELKIAWERERQLIKDDLGKCPDIGSISRSVVKRNNRLDVTFDAVQRHVGEKLDCKKFCDYCCYFKKEVTAEEVFTIVEYLKDETQTKTKKRVLQAGRTARNQIRRLSTAERMDSNIACALLTEGACSVYDVRPAVCRKVHSSDSGSCKSSFDHPGDSTIASKENKVINSVLSTMVAAGHEGLRDHNLDTTYYDLNVVLPLALTDNRHFRDWIKGKKPFT
jgi:Fe-S-cluster containining protein